MLHGYSWNGSIHHFLLCLLSRYIAIPSYNVKTNPIATLILNICVFYLHWIIPVRYPTSRFRECHWVRVRHIGPIRCSALLRILFLRPHSSSSVKKMWEKKKGIRIMQYVICIHWYHQIDLGYVLPDIITTLVFVLFYLSLVY